MICSPERIVKRSGKKCLKYRSFFILGRSKRTWALQRVSLDLTACKKKNQKAAPARPQLSMALADPAAGVTGFSRTDKLCLFKSCPVCLCVCVFHYNGPKHSPFLHCNWSITFWEAECMIFRVGGERERGGSVLSAPIQCRPERDCFWMFPLIAKSRGENDFIRGGRIF